jgi:nicotinate phosphoribosyltransferase
MADPQNQRRHPFEFFDFGTRRRFSREWHDEVIATLAREVPQYFRGTSNVELAFKHGLVPIGTMAHEHMQKHQGLGTVQLRRSVRAALEEWVQEYRGDLGIALTDVITTDAFLRDFDLYYAKLFDGVRHDSGDPDEWARKVLEHYKRLRIDARTKRLVFSNALTFDESFRLYKQWGDAAQHGSGIGTWLSNDMGLTPLNIVMKLKQVNQQPVAKISDDPSKALGEDPVFLAYLKQVFDVKAQ